MNDIDRVQRFLDLADGFLCDSKKEPVFTREYIDAADIAQGLARVAADPQAHLGFLDKARWELTSRFPLPPLTDERDRATTYRRLSVTYAYVKSVFSPSAA